MKRLAITRTVMVVGLVVLMGMLLLIGASAKPAPAPAPKPAPTAADFYKAKTVRFIIGYAPGGGTDTMARIAVPLLKEKIGAKVIVQNMTGAAGLEALNYMYLSAKPDGLTICQVPRDTLWGNWVMKEPGVQYDAGKFGYFGVLQPYPYVLVVKAGGPYASIEDMRRAKGLTFGGNSPADWYSFGAAVCMETLGCTGKLVTGYKGTAPQLLALLQGEVDAVTDTIFNAWRQRGQKQTIPLALIGLERNPGWPDLPSLAEVTKLSEDHRKLLGLYFLSGQVYIVPPGTPEDRVAFLATTTAEIASDKSFQKSIVDVLGIWLGYEFAKETKEKLAHVVENKEAYVKIVLPLIKKYNRP